MKPDLILTATPSNQRLLTPLSIFGKMVIKDIEGYPTIGSALLLTQEQGFFVADVLNSWGYTIKQRNFQTKQMRRITCGSHRNSNISKLYRRVATNGGVNRK